MNSWLSNMQNAAGKPVDLYIPRKCSWTNRLIAAKDHSSVQINVGKVDQSTGLYKNEYTTYALCGYIRSKGEADLAFTELCKRDNLL
eukprot:g1891.t1